ncbi:MAG: hypothetical protein D6687_02745 [Acidobacteria bacterium]|jgi:flagellar biogenesis protein FliO|nr:MAG: hypothetical protein D6687_02745 [Acidobacteriota bacterium]GIU82972.1 MAG: hypothetical protein KatS3mg006_2036 [Pyrinomonadaceae bacterium]
MLKIIAKKALILVLLVIFLTCYTEAQRKGKTPVTKSGSSASQIRQVAERVSTQLINVTRFIYVLGGVAREIEQIDQEAKKGNISKTTIERNEEFKRKVIQSIGDLRIGLAILEAEFRSDQKLNPYSTSLIGIVEDCNLAEEQAMSGQFVQAGRTLLTTVERLANTLVALSSAQIR